VVKAQKDSVYSFGDESGEIEYFFGFNLIPNAMGSLVHLVLIKPGEYGNRKIKQLSRDEFIAQASGTTESQANPDKVNFFKKYQIDNPNIIDELWRLRYKEYPYLTNDRIEPGWSVNDSISFLPSATQMQLLEKFGMYKLSDYIFGENAFKLLYLISKPEWVRSYKESF
jgi:hypothetical protein